jgi:hypothetical protein
MRKACGDVLAKLERELLADRTIDTEFSGSTFVFAAMRAGTLLVANCGDSRVTLGVEDGGRVKAEAVSMDHKPELPKEKARILAAGGRVFAVEYDDGVDGPPRVWLGHMDVPGLAMSRSIGDAVAHSAGVTTEPEFFTRPLTPRDRFLVSATDGLWEFLTDEEVVAMVAKIAAETGSPKAGGGAFFRRAPPGGRARRASRSASFGAASARGEAQLLPRRASRSLVLARGNIAALVEEGAPKPMRRLTSHPHTQACVDALVKESHDRWMKNEQVVDDTTVAVAFLSPDMLSAHK